MGRKQWAGWVVFAFAIAGCTKTDPPSGRAASVAPPAAARPAETASRPAPSSTLPSVATTRPAPVTFARIQTTGVRIAYVCDASGSMMNKFEGVRDRVLRSVAALRPPQSCAVLFFNDDAFQASSPGLLPATSANMDAVGNFVRRARPHGTSDPLSALRTAFAMEPDTIFLLTDGDFPNNAQVLKEIRKWNAGGRAKIHTLAIHDVGEYEKMLRTIAEENGGTYRFIESYETD